LNQSSVKELPSYSHYQNKIVGLGMQDSKPVLLVEDDCLTERIVHNGAKLYKKMAELFWDLERYGIMSRTG